jgi:hypothetical protein
MVLIELRLHFDGYFLFALGDEEGVQRGELVMKSHIDDGALDSYNFP